MRYSVMLNQKDTGYEMEADDVKSWLDSDPGGDLLVSAVLSVIGEDFKLSFDDLKRHYIQVPGPIDPGYICLFTQH